METGKQKIYFLFEGLTTGTGGLLISAVTDSLLRLMIIVVTVTVVSTSAVIDSLRRLMITVVTVTVVPS